MMPLNVSWRYVLFIQMSDKWKLSFILRLKRGITNGACPPPLPPSHPPASIFTHGNWNTDKIQDSWSKCKKYRHEYSSYGALTLAKRCDPFKVMHASQTSLLIYSSRFYRNETESCYWQRAPNVAVVCEQNVCFGPSNGADTGYPDRYFVVFSVPPSRWTAR
jgi:hypothetical protein